MKTSIANPASTRLFTHLAMLAATLCPLSASAAILSVGSTPDCTHGNLAVAVGASQPGDEIHLVSGAQTSGQAFISNSNLHIIGGFSSCAAANPDVGAVTALSPTTVITAPFIYTFSGSDTLLENVEISGIHNSSTDGGAIRVFANSRLAVANVRIHDNSAQRGAGIMVGGTLEIIAGAEPALLLDDNTASLGGGLYITAQGNVIAAPTAHVEVSGNVASVSGGGIYLERYGRLSLASADIEGNTATVSGGGIHVDAFVDYTAATPDLPNVDLGELVALSNNSSDGEGGGLYAGYTRAYHIAFTGVASNNNANRGGAMSLIGNGRLRMSGAEISSNTALTLGGGISLQSGVRFEMGASEIHHNNANRGGGLAIVGGTLTAMPSSTGLLIHDNTATDGGGIAIDQTSAAAFDGDCGTGGCMISENVATSRGGGLYSEGSPMLMGRGWIIDGNQAVDGGAIALQGGSFESKDAGANDSLVISNNTATNGGGIHVGASTLILRSTRLAANHASTAGGGLYVIPSGQPVDLANSRFIDNVAGDSGGAVYATSADNTGLNLRVAGISGMETMPISGAACNGDALPANQYCSEWRGNHSESHTCGEVLYLSGENINLNWEATALLDSPTLGAALCLDTNDALFSNSLITGNESGMFSFLGNGSRTSYVSIYSVTAINNTGSLLDQNASWIGDVYVEGLIARNNGATASAGFTPLITEFLCNFSEDGALNGDTRNPLFESTYRGDWRLTENSPARTACPNLNHSIDQDGFKRPLDSFEVGAFTRHPVLDHLFQNGFD